MKEVNDLSSEPLKLFEMFVNEKSRVLCNYGQLYIYGLKCVRKDLITKFEDMRNNVEFKKLKDLKVEELYEFNCSENLNLSIIDKDFERYFDPEKLKKIVQENLDETINPEKHNIIKEKEDDLLNFSHLGMSLLEVTDTNIEKNLGLNITNEETTGTLDTERLLGDVLKIPEDSKLNLLDDTNFGLDKNTNNQMKKQNKSGGLLFPGNDSTDEKRSASIGSQFSSKSDKKRRKTKDSNSRTGRKIDDNKSQKSIGKFGRKKKDIPKGNLDTGIGMKKPPILASTSTKNYQGPRVRSSSNVQEGPLSLHNFNPQDYLDVDSENNRISSTHSVGYPETEQRQRSYTGGGRFSNMGYGSRKKTPEPMMVKSGVHNLGSNDNNEYAYSIKSFAKTTDFSTVKSNNDNLSNYGSKIQFSYRSRSPKPKTISKGGRTPSKKRSRKQSQNISSGSLIMAQKPSRDTIPSEYHSLLIKLIDGVGTDFNFSDSQMGDRGVHFISYYINSLKSIECLRLNKCKVTDKGVAILCEGLANLKIQKLYLNSNLITVKGLSILYNYVKNSPGIMLITMKKNRIEKEKMMKYIKNFGALKVTLLV